jgi:hypothetical protein
MPVQQYVEPPSADDDQRAASTLPNWQVVARRTVGTVTERILGECWAPTWQRGLLVLSVIAGLLVVIALTLSVGNAVLVAAVGAVMRIVCEQRR